ncbi:MAG TPA: alpha/beta hydrolase [Vicinamibacterales bacterium]|nr:alpha/beta hydrolase [Vicinamibacterales bacterium]
MKTFTGSTGATVSYSVAGDGPPLVLVHGAFSDHDTNWAFVAPLFRQLFTVYAVARRGRGRTEATEGHTLEDEAQDVADVVRAIGAPVFLLGHSYGAHCALLAASRDPDRIEKLVLYEPAWPHMVKPDAMAALETLARAGAWDQFAYAFFANTLHVPTDDLDPLRASELWGPIVADGPATLGDLRALVAYRFDPRRFAELGTPVLLQIGSESPRDLYTTDALAAVLPRVQIDTLAGQAHEGMTTAPELYARATMRFLLTAATDPASFVGA